MAQFLYINSDPSTKARATQLGCGWLPSVPVQYSGLATAPCVIIAGAGQQVVVISDTPPTTASAVATAAAPIIAAENAAEAAQLTASANAATITANLTSAQTTIQNWIAANPSGAVLTAGQTLVVAKMLNGLTKILLSQFSSTSGT